MPPLSDPALALPWAQRQQPTFGLEDFQLTALAQKTHPLAKWWWGQRAMPEGYGAFCFVCDTALVTWARVYPITAMAKQTVMGHRAEHVYGRIIPR